MATVSLQKALGAFYTDELAAKRLVDWAISRETSSVLDPSCGGGVFLAAAKVRLVNLGKSNVEIHGIDVSPEALREARVRVPSAKLLREDFFQVTQEEFSRFDCIVGNPPFIRYQTFNGHSTAGAHSRALEAGVKLPRLASSWAPFVIHATRFLRQAGRLGMVMPVELGHAMYARDVLRFLLAHFRYVCVEMFRQKIFGDLSQSTVLLFCDKYGEQCTDFVITTADDLEGKGRQEHRIKTGLVDSGRFRFNSYVVPESVRQLYEGLAADKRVKRLGDVADVGIGSVTGANDFFHISDDERVSWEIDKPFLRPALLNLRSVSEFRYSRDTWLPRRLSGQKVYLLSVPPVPKSSLPASLQRYLNYGESIGVAERYKCRIRRFWYCVPHVRIPDAFLSYMSGEQPALVANDGNFVAPNTLHILRFAKDACPALHAMSWRNSLTLLSCELEGHSLGGGLFKLEPSEAENVLVVLPRAAQAKPLSEQLLNTAKSRPEQILEITDRHVLRQKLGLSKADCILLRDAARQLESWRKHK